MSESISQPHEVKYSEFISKSARVSLYVWMFSIIAWVYALFPDFGFGIEVLQSPIILWIFPCLLLLFVVHELIHAISIPQNLFHKNTKLRMTAGKSILHSGFGIAWGGAISRNQFIFCSIMPFMVLSVFPVLWLLFGTTKPNLLIGFLAACNNALSVVDLAQAYLLARHLPSNAILGNE